MVACASTNSSGGAFRKSNAPSPSESVVQRQLEAYNRHDLEAFLATYAEDVKLYRMPSAEPTISGKAQLGEFYRRSRFNLPALHAQVVHRAVLGNKVVDHERVFGLKKDAVDAVAVYAIADGRIVTVWLFYPD